MSKRKNKSLYNGWVISCTKKFGFNEELIEFTLTTEREQVIFEERFTTRLYEMVKTSPSRVSVLMSKKRSSDHGICCFRKRIAHIASTYY